MIRNRRLIYDSRFTNPWWLAGGIAESACTAAWQAVGAPSYDASKINLANRGLYDAYEGVAPSWDKDKGWYFAGAQYLQTLVSINRTGQTKSLIVRFSGHPSGSGYKILAGAWNGSGTTRGRFWVSPEWGENKIVHTNGHEVVTSVTGGYNNGVMAVAGAENYYNGADLAGTIPVGDVTGTDNFTIGAVYNSSTGFSNPIISYIQAVAVYAQTTLTPEQVLAVTNAMNAL